MARSAKPSVWIERCRSRNGRLTYRVRWEKDGRRGASIACGTSAEFAREKRSELEQQLWAGRLGLKADRRIHTLRDLWEAYERHCRQQKAAKTLQDFDRPAVEGFAAVVGWDAPLAQLGPEDVLRWKDALLKTRKAAGVSMLLRHLKAAFNYAVDVLEWIGRNPAARVPIPASDFEGRALTDAEIQAILAAATPRARGPVLLSLYCGLRLGEVLHLDHRMLRRQGGAVLLQVIQARRVGAAGDFRTKTRRSRVVHVPAEVRPYLGDARDAGRVFPGLTKGNLEYAFWRAVRRAGLGRVRFHDLRHTWATRWLEGGGSVRALQDAGGWASGASLKHYLHLSRDFVHAEASKVRYALHLPPAVPPDRAARGRRGDVAPSLMSP